MKTSVLFLTNTYISNAINIHFLRNVLYLVRHIIYHSAIYITAKNTTINYYYCKQYYSPSWRHHAYDVCWSQIGGFGNKFLKCILLHRYLVNVNWIFTSTYPGKYLIMWFIINKDTTWKKPCKILMLAWFPWVGSVV